MEVSIKMLARSDFDRAASFINVHARPLERTLYEFHFGSASVEDVKRELSTFQNNDGGFGHGPEPDFTQAASSPLATTVAFQILREIGVSADDEIVQGGIEYFVPSFNSQQRD